MTQNLIKVQALLILFCLFLFQSEVYAQNNDAVSNRQTDSLALVEFYISTEGATWDNKWSLTQTMDDWYGVTLNASGRVICLDLDGDPDCLYGVASGNGLRGFLTDLNLPKLERLSLASNNLIGEVPNFKHLVQLKVLNLSCNNLKGAIPDFKKLPKLVTLELDYNAFRGKIPNFSNLPLLQNLYLLSNFFTGAIPNFKNLPELRSIIADYNLLNGKLPNLKNCKKLKLLKCSDNEISSTIPDWGHLEDLRIIDFANNDLRGELWDWSKNTNLKILIFSNNDLKGTMPALEKLKLLEELDLSNNALEGEIANISTLPKLRSYQLGNNDFSSCPDFKAAESLEFFSAFGNQLTFKDLLPNQKYYTDQGDYLYQEIFLDDTLIVANEGDALDISFDLDENIETNIYTWYINGHKFVEKEGTNNLAIESLSIKHSGVYYCTIVNPNLKGLRLKSQSFYVEVATESDQFNTIPLAVEDYFEFESGESIYEFDIAANDDFQNLNSWRLAILDPPTMGTLEDMGYGKMSFHVPEGYSGELFFDYELCNVFNDTLCSIGTVQIAIESKPLVALENIFIPEDFSPNGDGIKDYYEIKGIENFEKVSLAIYDQTGRLVYQADDYNNDWNGKYRNTQTSLPMGIYFYNVVLQGREQQQMASGSLLLARD